MEKIIGESISFIKPQKNNNTIQKQYARTCSYSDQRTPLLSTKKKFLTTHKVQYTPTIKLTQTHTNYHYYLTI